RERFIKVIYFGLIVAPLRFMKYQWAYFQVNTLGQGKNVYIAGASERPANDGPWPRLGTAFGIAYLLGFNVLTWLLTVLHRVDWLIPAGLIGFAVAVGVAMVLPQSALFPSPFRQVYSSRIGGIARLGFFTVLLEVLAHLRWATGGASAI